MKGKDKDEEINADNIYFATYAQEWLEKEDSLARSDYERKIKLNVNKVQCKRAICKGS